MSKPIDTDSYSARLRARGVRPASRQLLIARIAGSEQAADLKKPPNCRGFGRIRHFFRSHPNWPSNPLPIDPALRALGMPSADEIQAQVFQNAACNWRCWYCFVPYRLLEARADSGDWFTAEQLVDLYLEEDPTTRPPMIDLTGGQPELVPEWVPWMMEALRARDLEGKVFLWSDDNLSNDYFWRLFSEEQIADIARFRGYGRVGCFKGFDAQSFAFNTEADPSLFDRQFELYRRMLTTGIDMYAYATFTAPDPKNMADKMRYFVDRLQDLHELLPLRTVPLKIGVFGVVKTRLAKPGRQLAVAWSDAERNQQIAIEAWNRELEARFSAAQRGANVVDLATGPIQRA